MGHRETVKLETSGQSMKSYLEIFRRTESFLVLSIYKAEERWLVAMETEYTEYHRGYPHEL